MKQKWENPSLIEMGVENTNDGPQTLDLVHGGSKPHIHFCNGCNFTTEIWTEAEAHDLAAGEEHTVGTRYLIS